MLEKSWLNSFEIQIVKFLEQDMFDLKAKDFFLADLSWSGWEENKTESRMDVIVRFFTHRHGKKYFDQLPENIKNKILAHSL